MDIISTQKFVRMSPRKLRLVADLVRKVEPVRAIDILPHVGKKAADPVLKVIKTAVANAKQKGISDTDLILKDIQINEGPMLKRGRPVSRGRWHPYNRRMSHIRVVLTIKEKGKQADTNMSEKPKDEKNVKRLVDEKKDKKISKNTKEVIKEKLLRRTTKKSK